MWSTYLRRKTVRTSTQKGALAIRVYAPIFLRIDSRTPAQSVRNALARMGQPPWVMEKVPPTRPKCSLWGPERLSFDIYTELYYIANIPCKLMGLKVNVLVVVHKKDEKRTRKRKGKHGPCVCQSSLNLTCDSTFSFTLVIEKVRKTDKER
jgi:hypothetical protein